MKLNLTATNKQEELILAYLEENATVDEQRNNTATFSRKNEFHIRTYSTSRYPTATLFSIPIYRVFLIPILFRSLKAHVLRPSFSTIYRIRLII